MYPTITRLKYASNSDKKCIAPTVHGASTFMNLNQFYEESFHTPLFWEWTSNIWLLAYKHRRQLRMRIYLKHSCKKEQNLKTSILVNACLSLKGLVSWVELEKDHKISKLELYKGFKYLQPHPHLLLLLLLPLTSYIQMKFCKITITTNLYISNK